MTTEPDPQISTLRLCPSCHANIKQQDRRCPKCGYDQRDAAIRLLEVAALVASMLVTGTLVYFVFFWTLSLGDSWGPSDSPGLDFVNAMLTLAFPCFAPAVVLYLFKTKQAGPISKLTVLLLVISLIVLYLGFSSL